MNLGPIQSEASAIVASWLPGTEGEGVADTLVGKAAFTGRLPESWAKSVTTTTTPVNVGDKSYDPLYPYGWGLRTDSPKARLVAVKAALDKGAAGVEGHRASKTLNVLLHSPVWNSNGTVKNAPAALTLLTAVALDLGGTSTSIEVQANAVVSVARDIVQQAIVKGGAKTMTKAAGLTADAEHSLMSGDPRKAVVRLTAAYWLAV
jgi:beta-glucosidase